MLPDPKKVGRTSNLFVSMNSIKEPRPFGNDDDVPKRKISTSLDRKKEAYEIATKKGFDYEFLAKIEPYIVCGMQTEYIDIQTHAELIRTRRIELQTQFLKPIETGKKGLYFYDKNVSVLDFHAKLHEKLKSMIDSAENFGRGKEENIHNKVSVLLETTHKMHEVFNASKILTGSVINHNNNYDQVIF